MKLGVFFSNCDGVLSRSLDLASLSREYEPDAVVRVVESFYEEEDLNMILMDVEKNDLDSVILAGETPSAYQAIRNGDYLFSCLSHKGVNSNRIAPVNLKNMVVLAHDANPPELQLKAKLLVDVGIEKLKLAKEVTTMEISPRKALAVIGADLSGIVVAQHLLDQGFRVYLIDDRSKPVIRKNEKSYVNPTLAHVSHHPRFSSLYGYRVKDFFGVTGDYTLVIEMNGDKKEIYVGGVVLSLENATEEQLKSAHAIFHVDLKADGTLQARDEVSANSMTMEGGVFIVNPGSQRQGDIGSKFMAADATAAMVINILNQKEVYHHFTISSVDKNLCSGCGACVKTCIFHAVSIQGTPPLSVIDIKRCRGCGNCVAACPSDARGLVVCPPDYLFNAVKILSEFKSNNGSKKSLVVACDGCGYPCLDRAGEKGLTWPVSAMPLQVVCGGQIDTQLIMQAFVEGFDNVILMVCGEGLCHNIIGNVELERRVHLFREILASRGIDHERMQVITTSTKGDEACISELNRICG